MRLALPFVLSLSAAAALAGAPSLAEFAASINYAGRQRMLNQRAAKEALQIALKIEIEDSKAALKRTMGVFEEALVSLATGNPGLKLPVPSAAVAAQVKILKGAWTTLAADLQEALADRSDPTKIVASGREVTREAQALVDLLQAEYTEATGKIWGVVVDLAGKQRMLSQKMARDVLQIELKIHPETHRAALKLTVATFDRTLRGLANGDAELGLPPTTDRKARTQIQAVGAVWAEYRPMVDRVVVGGTLSAEDLRKMATLNLRLLEESDKTVTIFGGLASDF